MPLDKPAVETKDEKLFFALVRAAFNMRRKTLVNALGPVLGSSMSKEAITALVEAASLDARVRGERLSLAEYETGRSRGGKTAVNFDLWV